MSFSKEYIKSKVGNYKCPQGKCGEIAIEMAESILGGKCQLIANVQCCSLEETLTKIASFLTNNNLVVIWPSSGFCGPNPAWHSYIVFNANPLQSFAAWEQDNEFYDEKETKEKIENTINSEKHNKVITIHQYGRNKS